MSARSRRSTVSSTMSSSLPLRLLRTRLKPRKSELLTAPNGFHGGRAGAKFHIFYCVKIDNGHSDFKKGKIVMPDSSFHFGGLVSEFVHAAIGGPTILPQGQDVSSFVHTFIPGNPVEPQGLLVSEFVHAAQVGLPILPQGQEVSSFVHAFIPGEPVERQGHFTRNYIAFAAQYLACTPPCQRFACCLAAVSRARLGVSVDRYSFTVTDFHHLPPAGLPGAPQLNGSPAAFCGCCSSVSLSWPFLRFRILNLTRV